MRSSKLHARDLDIPHTILTHHEETSLLNKLNFCLLQEAIGRYLRLCGTDWLAVQITSECLYEPLVTLSLWLEIIQKEYYCVHKKDACVTSTSTQITRSCLQRVDCCPENILSFYSIFCSPSASLVLVLSSLTKVQSNFPDSLQLTPAVPSGMR